MERSSTKYPGRGMAVMVSAAVSNTQMGNGSQRINPSSPASNGQWWGPWNGVVTDANGVILKHINCWTPPPPCPSSGQQSTSGTFFSSGGNVNEGSLLGSNRQFQGQGQGQQGHQLQQVGAGSEAGTGFFQHATQPPLYFFPMAPAGASSIAVGSTNTSRDGAIMGFGSIDTCQSTVSALSIPSLN